MLALGWRRADRPRPGASQWRAAITLRTAPSPISPRYVGFGRLGSAESSPLVPSLRPLTSSVSLICLTSAAGPTSVASFADVAVRQQRPCLGLSRALPMGQRRTSLTSLSIAGARKPSGGMARRHLHEILRRGRSLAAPSLPLPPPGAFKILDYDCPTPDATCFRDNMHVSKLADALCGRLVVNRGSRDRPLAD